MITNSRSPGTSERLAHVRRLTASGLARSIRIAARVSQSEVAQEAGVTPSAIARWEGGSRLPRGEAALRYLEVLTSLQADQ